MSNKKFVDLENLSRFWGDSDNGLKKYIDDRDAAVLTIATSAISSHASKATSKTASGHVKIGDNISVSTSGVVSLTKENVTNALGYTPPTTNTTYNVVTSSVAGLAPKIGTAVASTIGTQSTEWVLASTNGGAPTWRKLPANAFNNTTYSFSNKAATLSWGTTTTIATVGGTDITIKLPSNPNTSFSYITTVGDNRAVATTPNDYSEKLIFQGLKSNSSIGSPSTDMYSYVLGLRGWTDKSGGDSWELAFNNTGIYTRSGETTWNSWNKLVHNSDLVTSSVAGLAPKIGTAAAATINSQANDWVLTTTSGGAPTWRKLPSNAFNNTTYSTATSSAAGLAPKTGTAAAATIATQADEWVLTTTKGGASSWRKLPDNAFKNDNTVYTHPTAGANTGSFGPSANASPAHGGSFSVPYLTVNSSGHVTAAATKTITLPNKYYESRLSWGDTSLAAELSPVDVATDGLWSSNRLSFMPASDIAVEYSTNGGSTWTDYGLTNDQKVSLVTTGLGTTICPGKKTSAQTTNCQVRVTITATSGKTYFTLKKIYTRISTNYANNTRVKIEKAMVGTDTTFTNVGDYSISGWSGWNSIPMVAYFGGERNQTSNVRKIRMTFYFTSVSSGNESKVGFQIYSIAMIGENSYFNSGGPLPATGHMYSYDVNKYVTFPSRVSATEFYENGTALSSKYATPAQASQYASNLQTKITNGSVVAKTATNATNATTATKLGSANKGSATQPIYLSSGTPTACTYTLSTSVPSNAKFTDTTYDTVTSSVDGLAPKMGTAAAATIATQADEWVLTTTKGGTSSWRKLPADAFNNTTYSLATTTSNGLMSSAQVSKLNSLSTAVATSTVNGLMSATQCSMVVPNAWSGADTIGRTANRLYLNTKSDLLVNTTASTYYVLHSGNYNQYIDQVLDSQKWNGYTISVSSSIPSSASSTQITFVI